MHLTLKSTTRRFGPLATAAMVFGCLLLLALPAAALARSSYDGGPIKADSPTTIANDGTVYALRFSAADDPATTDSPALLPDTRYYVKVRFTTDWQTGQPASTDNRGFTWSGSPANAWLHWDASSWEEFPSVMTDSSGAIAQSQWLYFKFADTTKSGKYGLMVSLSVGGTGNTQNGTRFIPVTVADPATGSAWVHDGADTGQAGGASARVVDHATGDPIAVQLTESNGCDDDSNGTVDDEQYGPVKTGGFRVAVPVGRALDAKLDGSVWPAVSGGFSVAVPDTDIALGAADQVAPTAAGGLTAAPRMGGAVLAWTPASDAGGVSSYRVYRWIDAPPGLGYTAVPALAGTVTGVTTFTDSGLANGTVYHYLVRAVDAATNVGPRSQTANATPDDVPPGAVTGLAAVPGDTQVSLSWTRPADVDLAGVRIVRKTGAEPTGPADGVVVYEGTAASFLVGGLTNGTQYQFAAFVYDTALNWSTTAALAAATPNTVTALTFTVQPAIVSWGQPWTLTGELKTAAGAQVPDAAVELEESDGGVTWQPSQLSQQWTPTAGTSTYSASVAAPPAAARFRLVYAGDARHLASRSEAKTVTPRVKLGKPSAPPIVRKGRTFSASGSLTPQQAAGSRTVKITCYLKDGGWKLKKTVTAANSPSGTASRYTARLSLPSRGSWKLVATSAATARYAAATSVAASVRVK